MIEVLNIAASLPHLGKDVSSNKVNDQLCGCTGPVVSLRHPLVPSQAKCKECDHFLKFAQSRKISLVIHTNSSVSFVILFDQLRKYNKSSMASFPRRCGIASAMQAYSTTQNPVWIYACACVTRESHVCVCSVSHVCALSRQEGKCHCGNILTTNNQCA